MNYARIINEVAIDVSTNPTLNFTPDIASQFVQVADDVKPGWKLITEIVDGAQTANKIFKSPATFIESYEENLVQKYRYAETPAQTTSTIKPPKVTVIEYKMLFTSAERIAVKASADPVIIDLQELMNDPRTVNVDLSLQSISDALDYMTYLGLIAVGRKAEILIGVVK